MKVRVPVKVQVPRKGATLSFVVVRFVLRSPGNFQFPSKRRCLPCQPDCFAGANHRAPGKLGDSYFPMGSCEFLGNNKTGSMESMGIQGSQLPTPPQCHPTPPRFCWILSHYCPLIRPAIWGGWACLIPMNGGVSLKGVKDDQVHQVLTG